MTLPKPEGMTAILQYLAHGKPPYSSISCDHHHNPYFLYPQCDASSRHANLWGEAWELTAPCDSNLGLHIIDRLILQDKLGLGFSSLRVTRRHSMQRVIHFLRDHSGQTYGFSVLETIRYLSVDAKSFPAECMYNDFLYSSSWDLL